MGFFSLGCEVSWPRTFARPREQTSRQQNRIGFIPDQWRNLSGKQESLRKAGKQESRKQKESGYEEAREFLRKARNESVEALKVSLVLSAFSFLRDPYNFR